MYTNLTLDMTIFSCHLAEEKVEGTFDLLIFPCLEIWFRKLLENLVWQITELCPFGVQRCLGNGLCFPVFNLIGQLRHYPHIAIYILYGMCVPSSFLSSLPPSFLPVFSFHFSFLPSKEHQNQWEKFEEGKIIIQWENQKLSFKHRDCSIDKSGKGVRIGMNKAL